jgi:hypothetical protein
VSFNDVAFFPVGKAITADAALEACGHLLDVVFIAA